MGNLKIEITHRNDEIILSAEGEISLFNIEELRDAVASVAQNTQDTIIIDMKNILSVDSTGIAALFAAQKKVEALKKKFFLSNLDESIMDIFAITGIKFNMIDLENDTG